VLVENAQVVPHKPSTLPLAGFRSYLHFGTPLAGYALSLGLTALAGYGELPFLRQPQFSPPFSLLYPAFTLFYPPSHFPRSLPEPGRAFCRF